MRPKRTPFAKVHFLKNYGVVKAGEEYTLTAPFAKVLMRQGYAEVVISGAIK